VAYQRSRSGTSQDRGRVLPWKPSVPTENNLLRRHGLVAKSRRALFGLASGSADVDPTLILTATVAGAAYAYSLLWVVILCVPFLITVFSVSTRLGTETHKGLVDLIRENYGRVVALGCAAVVLAINFTMIVADLMAVSDALSIVLGHPRMYFVALVAFSVWYILILHDYRHITRVFLWLTLPLFAYVIAAIFAAPSWNAVVLNTVLPRVPHSPGYVGAILAMFGSLLTPYVLVWKTSSRRERAENKVLLPITHSYAGRIVTCILAYSIIVATSSVLHLPFASNMTTLRAADALQSIFGLTGPLLFSLGIIACGMVALPVLVASMSYSLSEAMGWRSGLSEQPWEAKSFYVLITLTMLAAACLNFRHVNPARIAFLSQILAGILAIPVLLFILMLSNDRRTMKTTNSRWQNFWFGAALGGLAASSLLYAWWKLV